MIEVGYNKRAVFDYEILEKIEAGIVLEGCEVKSLRFAKANMSDSYATINPDNQAYLYNLYIPEYKMSVGKTRDSKRIRKLLLHRRELNKLSGILRKGGYSLIPISIYFNSKGFIKLQLGVGRGKKLIDKREIIKEREWNREKSRIFKRQL